jgi:hypothetical protein
VQRGQLSRKELELAHVTWPIVEAEGLDHLRIEQDGLTFRIATQEQRKKLRNLEHALS